MLRNFLFVAIPFLLISCMSHRIYNTPPVCKCECKCPSENKKSNTTTKEDSNKNFLTDDVTIQDILGDR